MSGQQLDSDLCSINEGNNCSNVITNLYLKTFIVHISFYFNRINQNQYRDNWIPAYVKISLLFNMFDSNGSVRLFL